MKKSFLFALSLCLSLAATADQVTFPWSPNLFIGTANDYGQMTPGATVPFGQIQVCPDSNPRQHPGYDYEQPLISGISINRLSGVGGSGCGGNVSLMPDASGQGIQLVKETEKAVPGSYQVTLSNGVTLSATATHRMAVEDYTYPQGMEPVMLLNPASSFERCHKSAFNQLDANTGQGMVECSNTCGRGRYHLYYKLFSSAPFRMEDADKGLKRLTFYNLTSQTIEIRIVVSTGIESELSKVSHQNVWAQSWTEISNQALKAWSQILNRVKVDGGTPEQRTLFYTSLYRVFHSPFQITDEQFTQYLGTDGSTYERKGNDYYSSWSLWDTYRTKFPLITLLQPERSQDIMTSLAQLYITGKKDWSTDFECTPTVRTEHAIATLLDAYRQGIQISNLREAYPGMANEVRTLPLKSPDQCLEAAGDFWALSELATELKLKKDAKMWKARGEEIFDSIWPKEFQNIDDTYTKMRGNGLYQGTRWQYRWGAPMYLPRMIKLVGKQQLAQQLTTFFQQELYNQGNEPDIHVPFLFARLGMPQETGKVVYALGQTSITHRYGGNDAYPQPFVGKAFTDAPRGYCPEMDEDDGAMSAWYVFAAIGMYPVVVGEATYELFSPLFDHILLQLDAAGTRTMTIRTVGRTSPTQPVQMVTWNGKKLSNFQLPHTLLRKGGELVFYY